MVFQPQYEGMREWLSAELQAGRKPAELYQTAVERFGYTSGQSQFRNYCVKLRIKLRNQGIQGAPADFGPPEPPPQSVPDTEAFLNLIREAEAVSVLDLCTELDCPPSRIHDLVEYHQTKGVDVYQNAGQVMLSKVPLAGAAPAALGDREIIFGVASDLHFGSRAVQITALQEFCKECRRRGVRHILCPGDVFSGRGVYKGQDMDVYAHSAPEQEASALRNIPEGFDWYLLGGNHDYSFFRTNGHNAVKALAAQRDDLHYLGFDEAVVPLLPGVDAVLWHPSGGVAYALSYRLQKATEQIAYDELMNIVREKIAKPTVRFFLAGHLHIQLQALMGSIFAAQCGCFEGVTNYLKRKKLVPAIGGYIIEAGLDKKGRLKNFDAKFHLFEEIEDDWRSFEHTLEEAEGVPAPILG